MKAYILSLPILQILDTKKGLFLKINYLRYMKKLLGLCAFLALLSCEVENSVNPLLDNSKWKVSKTTHEYLDGTSKVFTDDLDGGFYITLKNDNKFYQEWYPYSATGEGHWTYSSTSKKLGLIDANNNLLIEYDVQLLTKDKLVLYNENSLQNRDGFVKLTLELSPF